MMHLLISGVKKKLGLIDSTQWSYVKLHHAIRRYQRSQSPLDEPDSCYLAFVVRLEAIALNKTLTQREKLDLAWLAFDNLKHARSNEMTGGIQVIYDK